MSNLQLLNSGFRSKKLIHYTSNDNNCKYCEEAWEISDQIQPLKLL